jgi:hypothetical protein
VQCVVGEEQIDGCLVPEHAHLLVARDQAPEPRVACGGTQCSQRCKHALCLVDRQEHVQVDVVGCTNAAVIAQGLGASEGVGDPRGLEGVFDGDDLLVEEHRI